MKKSIFLSFLLLILVTADVLGATGISRQTKTDSLVSEWKEMLKDNHFEDLISSARSSFFEAESEGDVETFISSGIYLAQAYLPSSCYDSVLYFMRRVEDYIVQSHDENRKMILYNVKAILAISRDMDYENGIVFFNKALEAARNIPSPSDECLILCNIAEMYVIRKDTVGFHYAAQAYDYAKQLHDTAAVSSSASLLVKMYILREEYEEAMHYVDELYDISLKTDSRTREHGACQLKAEVLLCSGNEDEAGRWYKRAFKLKEYAEDDLSAIRGYLDYGNYLLRKHDLDSARSIFEEGLTLSMDKNNMTSVSGLLLGLSETYRLLSDKQKAYDYYRQYHLFKQNEEVQERNFQNYLSTISRLRYDKEIGEKELQLALAKKRIYSGIAISVSLLIILSCVIILYSRKNRMYRRLTENYYRMSKLAEREKEASSQDRVEDDSGLYEQIEKLMKDDKLYRHNDISLDTLATLLKTNRSYISKAINQSGMSFYNYINHYRIKEAVEVLSNPSIDIPLKALCEELGFNSTSVFYRSFCKETGVPPSHYRSEIRRIKAEE